jgi:hypothetical protein
MASLQLSIYKEPAGNGHSLFSAVFISPLS